MGSGLLLYIAAKIHFFGWYDPFNKGDYLQKHSWFWIVLLAVGLLIWVIERSATPRSRL
jgi:hypothetical protein